MLIKVKRYYEPKPTIQKIRVVAPVWGAYSILLQAREGLVSEAVALEEALGYLGQALSK